jgi:hypothetical protein
LNLHAFTALDPKSSASANSAIPAFARIVNHCIERLSGFTSRRVPDKLSIMTIPAQPNFTVSNTNDYRETYANSVQVRVNVWDFFLVFGTMQQQSETQVEVRNFQGIYLSPQQAKALAAILHQNVSNYEGTFGEIKLDPRIATAGPIH